MPTELVAGQDHEVGFTILQHGQTPVHPDAGDIGIRLVEVGSGQARMFPAVAEGPHGHFVSTVNVPSAGTWTWEVMQGWFEPQPLGTIDVVSASAAGASGTTSTTATSGTDAWRIAALVLAAVLLVAFVVELVVGGRRSRPDRRSPTAPATA
jgi:hypothetical protein